MDEIGLAEGVRIAHWTPGRVRFSFEDIAEADQFARAAINLQSVTCVKSNALTGSVLIIYTENDVCTRCRQPVAAGADIEVMRRFLSLIAAVLMGDLIGVVAWVWSAADAGSVVHAPALQRHQLSLAA